MNSVRILKKKSLPLLRINWQFAMNVHTMFYHYCVKSTALLFSKRKNTKLVDLLCRQPCGAQSSKQ